MISYLQGTIKDHMDHYSTIVVHGVGYAVYTANSWKQTHQVLESCEVFIYTHVKEDAIELYGFETRQERTLFEHLLSVSGIGPRSALLIVGNGVSETITAIAQADVSYFTSIPRIGKKNAQKIIIELKNKVGGTNELDLAEEGSPMVQDIVEALTSMGFAKQDVLFQIKAHFNADETLETNMKVILKLLSKKK
jgi:Holliday junction DNA helicase RuvA